MVADTAYYDALELQPTATLDEIKKSYKRLAMKYHPDKNSSPDAEGKFKIIGEAYEVLSDTDARRKYDLIGKTESRGSGGSGAGVDPFSVFEKMFGFKPNNGGMPGFNFGDIPGFNNMNFGFNNMSFNNGNASFNQGTRRTEDLIHPLNIPLEHFYNSGVKKIKLNRDKICSDCNGQGGSNITSCVTCNGRGINMKVTRDSRNPNMIQQSSTTCRQCDGTGKKIQNLCTGCEGKKVINVSQIVEIGVGKGYPNNHRVVFPKMSNEAIGAETGDAIFILQQATHSVFTRNNSDLVMDKTITLAEALTGFKFRYTHLDGREVEVTSKPGNIISPGQQKRKGEGMPKEGTSGGIPIGEFGDLYINYKIKFPSHIKQVDMDKLREILTE